MKNIERKTMFCNDFLLMQEFLSKKFLLFQKYCYSYGPWAPKVLIAQNLRGPQRK